MGLEETIEKMALIYNVEADKITESINHMHLAFKGYLSKKEVVTLVELALVEEQVRLEKETLTNLTPERVSEAFNEILGRLNCI